MTIGGIFMVMHIYWSYKTRVGHMCMGLDMDDGIRDTTFGSLLKV